MTEKNSSINGIEQLAPEVVADLDRRLQLIREEIVHLVIYDENMRAIPLVGTDMKRMQNALFNLLLDPKKVLGVADFKAPDSPYSYYPPNMSTDDLSELLRQMDNSDPE